MYEQPTDLYNNCNRTATPELLETDNTGIYCENCNGYIAKFVAEES